MTANARMVAALAIAGLLLLLLTRIEWVQALTITGPGVRPDERAGAAPAAVKTRRPLEDRHGEVFVTPITAAAHPR